jgi:D-arabinose 1-dehydrogenase-like Zn-dependent alcohol dehydrogenase
VAAGRNPEVLHALNANAVIPLEAPEDAIREAYQRELAQGIDVVIDFLWGRPTELLLEAMAKDFRFDTVRRTRLIEVGESAGKAITLPGATLRSVDLTLCGSGLGSVPVGQIMAAIPELFSMAAAGTLEVDVERVPLEQVEQAWNRVEKGRRIVFTI